MPASLKIHPGRVAPSQMDARSWSRFASQVDTDYFKGGQTDYDTGIGFWLGFDAGTPKLSLGNSAGNKVTWDGSTLSITGTITATTGTIGGWTLAATHLTSGSGANTVRLDSAGTNPAISAGSATPASAPFRVSQAGALVATSATITGAITATSGSFTGTVNANAGAFTGGITVGTGGSISSGQSGYDNGTGWWLEYNGGTPRLSLGNSGGNKLTWNGSTLALTGSMTLTNAAQTFTPTWTGFSTDPVGDFSYIDFGTYVMLFSGVTVAGDSNATTMSISNLPLAIRPSALRTVDTVVVDNAIVQSGYANVATDGNVYFFRDQTANFTTGDVPKSWPAVLIYPK